MTKTTDRASLVLNTTIDQQTADRLIARYIKPDPDHSGRHEARVVTDLASPSVWIIISYLQGGYDVAYVADGYDLTDEAVTAAIAFYQRYRELIDAKLLLQNESFSGFEWPRG